MAPLIELASGFLAADGYAVSQPEPGLLAGERAGERRRVWVADGPGAAATVGAHMRRIRAAAAAAPDVSTYVLVPALTGLSNELRQEIARLGIGLRVPVQFFDTPYRADPDGGFGTGEARGARSVFSDYLRSQAAAIKGRVPQPYHALTQLGGERGGFATGEDLLTHLFAQLAKAPEVGEVIVIAGAAGAGKSSLFAALFAALFEHFTAEKRSQRLAPRPILFLPEHIRSARVTSMSGLLAAVAETDAAAATPPRLMSWLNVAGFTTWMFDGLDEFFAGETDFVATLEQRLAPASRGRVVLCTRDSLLTTSSALSAFLDGRVSTGRGVTLYELARWERPSQRALAWMRLAGRLPPAASGGDPAPVARFLAALDASPVASDLAALPFYCDLMLAAASRPAADQPRDEFELLGTTVEAMIDREAAKLASGEIGFTWDVFAGADTFVDVAEMVEKWGAPRFAAAGERERLQALLEAIGRDRLVELIEGIAHLLRCNERFPGEARGLSVDELEELGQIYLDVGVDPEIEPRVLLAIVQLAFFGPGAAQGTVRFSHEIIADYLAARHAARRIAARPESADVLGQALGIREDMAGSPFLRALVHELREVPQIVDLVRAHVAADKVRPAYAANAALLAKALGSR